MFKVSGIFTSAYVYFYLIKKGCLELSVEVTELAQGIPFWRNQGNMFLLSCTGLKLI